MKGKLLVADAPLSQPTGVHRELRESEREMCDLEIASALEQAPPYNLSPPFFLTGNLKHHLRRSQSHKKYRDFVPDANAMDDNLSQTEPTI